MTTAYPIWVTPAGNLGKIPALQFFQLSLGATDPLGGSVTFQLVAGKLPAGMQIDSSGQVLGNPKETYSIDGVPESVTQDRTSTFTVRATNTAGYITDRSFSITVTGNYPPQLLTSNYTTLGEFIDGTVISIQLSAVDLNNDTLTYSLLNGQLPNGTTLSSTGLISGALVPTYIPPTGWDLGSVPWDSGLWDETTVALPAGQSYNSIGKITYYFTVQVSDGKSIDTKDYSIVVLNHDAITADSTLITDDDSNFSSDTSNYRLPLLLTTSLGNYATFTSGNYFEFQFEGIDYDNIAVGYSVVGTTGTGWDADTVPWDESPWDQSNFNLPPGLSLDSNTGWMTGYVPPQSYISQTYTFGVQVYSLIDNTNVSAYTIFSITILGSISLGVNWTTPSSLGSINAGEISQLSVSAVASSGRQLYYSLASGSRLPQGLTLLSDGTISGRVSFQQFDLDQGTTTFDVKNSLNGATTGITTIDRTYNIIVDAADFSQSISGQQTFTLTVNNVTYSPYDNLYLVCLPPVSKRSILETILSDTDYFDYADLYRPNDPYWGVQSDIKVLVGYGLTPNQASTYIAAMQQWHYKKRFYFGDYNYATATDSNGNPLYDVIYVNLFEDTKTYSLVNGILNGNQPSSSFIINSGTTVYPNDLNLMINDIDNAIGITDINTLPQWLTSVQSDGNILGYHTVAVLAYLKAGTGERVLFNLKNTAKPDIKLIPFTADRYIFDNNMDLNFDLTSGKFITKTTTTFDTGYVLSITPSATISYGLDIPFDHVNGATVAQINAIGGFDGDESGDWDGTTVIFSTQENYNPVEFPTLYNNGWNLNGAIVPGYTEVTNGTAAVNERGGVWTVSVNNGLVSLTFKQQILNNQVVLVQLGAKSGETLQYSTTGIGIGSQTVPKYNNVNIQTITPKSPTTFDNKKTQFINNEDQYQLPFANDSYLKFPHENILQ